MSLAPPLFPRHRWMNASVHQRARKHTRVNLGPYSANDVHGSHSPACPAGGALLCKPLCISNKTQGGRTQVKPLLSSFVLSSSAPDYQSFSSTPLWNDTFGQGGARGPKGGCSRWNFHSIFTDNCSKQRLDAYLILRGHTEGDQTIFTQNPKWVQV